MELKIWTFLCLFPIWPPDCRRREEGQRGFRRKNRQSWGQGAFWSLREPICSWLSKTKGRRKKKRTKHTKGRRRMWWMMTNEGGHYCSKKSDDICGNVCGQVFFNFLFFFLRIFFSLNLIFPIWDFCETVNPLCRVLDSFSFVCWFFINDFWVWKNVGKKKKNFLKILDLGFWLL